MSTLIVASRCVVYDRMLCEAASSAGWSVLACDAQSMPAATIDEPVVYVTTDLALIAARQLNLALIEPPLDLLTQLPERFLRRAVELATFADLKRLQRRTFVKPADPLDKWFDAGVYADVRDIRTRGRETPDSPVLLSEPVEWVAEYRYFVLEGKVIAGSSYLAFGRPAWKPFDPKRPNAMPTAGVSVIAELYATMKSKLPPVFVVDVGLIETRGWAVVEFNPVWCAGLLGADPRAVLPVLQRATRRSEELTAEDERWIVDRGE
jgi:hypothetical protein